MRTRLRILLSLWWLFVALGLASVVGGLAAQRYEEARGPYGPVLLHPSAIAVSDSGQIFVYANWSEIRVFDPDGAFLRSWPVETLQGGARMAIDPDGNLNVGTVRNGKLYRFEPSGRLVHEEDNRDAFGNLPSDSFYRAVGPEASVYEIRGSAVIRVDADTTVATVVPGPPAYLSFFFGGRPRTHLLAHGVAIVVFGLALGYVGHTRRRRLAG